MCREGPALQQVQGSNFLSLNVQKDCQAEPSDCILKQVSGCLAAHMPRNRRLLLQIKPQPYPAHLPLSKYSVKKQIPWPPKLRGDLSLPLIMQPRLKQCRPSHMSHAHEFFLFGFGLLRDRDLCRSDQNHENTYTKRLRKPVG